MRHQLERRTIRFREQVDKRLPMRCDIWRPASGPEPAPGYEADEVPALYLANQPCYVWNLLYLLQGEFVFPEREYVTGQLRALLPYGLDITERDDIRNIRLYDDPLWPGPLNIFLVVPHSGFTLLVLRGAH